jgi:hypothetical protein
VLLFCIFWSVNCVALRRTGAVAPKEKDQMGLPARKPSLAIAKAEMADFGSSALCHLRRYCLAAKLPVAVTLPPIEVVCMEPAALAERF